MKVAWNVNIVEPLVTRLEAVVDLSFVLLLLGGGVRLQSRRGSGAVDCSGGHVRFRQDDGGSLGGCGPRDIIRAVGRRARTISL